VPSGGDVFSALIKLGVLREVDSTTVVLEDVENVNVGSKIANLLQYSLDLEAFFNGIGKSIVLSFIGRKSDLGL